MILYKELCYLPIFKELSEIGVNILELKLVIMIMIH